MPLSIRNEVSNPKLKNKKDMAIPTRWPLAKWSTKKIILYKVYAHCPTISSAPPFLGRGRVASQHHVGVVESRSYISSIKNILPDLVLCTHELCRLHLFYRES